MNAAIGEGEGELTRSVPVSLATRRKMASNWRWQMSQAVKLRDRKHAETLLKEVKEPNMVSRLRVPLSGSYKYQKKLTNNLTLADALVEGSMSLLEVASANGWVDVCRELVTQHGSTLEPTTVTEIRKPDGANKALQRSPLSYAVREGHVDVVAYLVRAFKLEIRDDNAGRALLTLAIIHGRLEMVKHLVTVCKISASKLSELAGAVLLENGHDKSRASPFIVACLQGCGDVIKYLVSEGHCDPRETSNWVFGETKISPLIAVAFKGSIALLEYVMNICNVCVFEHFWHPNVTECVIKDSEVVRFLIQHVDVQSLKQSEARQLLMMSSVCFGLLDCVKYLMENDIEYCHSLNVYQTHYTYKAACNGYYYVVKYLVEKCDVSHFVLNPVSQFTVYAASSSGSFRVLEYLLNEHSDFKPSDGHASWKKIAAHVACKYGHLAMVKDLVARYSLQLSENDNYFSKTRLLLPEVKSACSPLPFQHESILHVAAECGHLHMVKYLISRWNLDPNKRNACSQTALHFAAFNGHLSVVEHLLSAGSHLSPDANGNTPLHFACWQGHLSIAKHLIEQWQLNLSMINNLSLDPLCLAIEGGHVQVVEYLADMFPLVDPDSPMDDKGNTALHIAAGGGCINMVEYVIQKWITNPNQLNKDFRTPLHVAICRENLHVAEYLIKEFPGMVMCTDEPVDTDGDTALHVAIRWSSLCTVKYLISDCKLSPYKSNDRGYTPLHIAIPIGTLGMVRWLFGECSCVTPDASVDNKGNTALHVAAKHGHLDIVKFLVNECKVSPNKTNESSLTPLHVACCAGKMGVVEYLVEEFPGIVTCTDEFFDATENSPLHVAVEHGALSVVKYLLDVCKLNPNKTNQESLMPLHVAFSSGRIDVAEYLIEEFPSLFECTDASVDQNRNTALHIAVKHGSLKLVKYLIAECNLSPYNGNHLSHTPLYSAIANRNLSIVKWLFGECSSVIPDAPVDGEKNTALHVAAKYGHLDIAQCLINEGKLSPNESNDRTLTPLHVACCLGKVDVAEWLIERFPGVVSCNDRVMDCNGNTVLHLVAKQCSPIAIRYLINECKLTPYKNNYNRDTPLFIALRNGNLSVAQSLFSECPDVLREPVDNKGNTALIIAAEYGHLDVVKFLVNECKFAPNQGNNWSQTPLHVACCVGQMEVAEYFVENFPGVIMCTDKCIHLDGSTALHFAVKHASLCVMKYLIDKCNLSPYKSNSDSETPIYIAVRDGNLSVVKCLFNECSGVIANAPVDDKRNTALHIAAMHGHVDLVAFLTQECKLYPDQPNEDSSTPLHLAVAHNHLPVVKYLLKEKLCEASSLNADKCLKSANRETSLFLITEYDVKGHSAASGSRSVFCQNAKLLKGLKSSFPLHFHSRIFVVGDPACGKSTLTKSFRSLAYSFFPSLFGQTGGADLPTAGIVPVTIESKKLGNLVVYDLAGHPKYYSSHMAIMHKMLQENPAIFICVVNLSNSNAEVLKELGFWSSFIKMGALGAMARSQVIVVGSHADLLSKEMQLQKESLAKKVSQEAFVDTFVGLAMLDCRRSSSAGLTSLVRLVLKAQEAVQDKARGGDPKVSIPIFCHMLRKFLSDLRAQDSKASVYSLTDLSRLVVKENEIINKEAILVTIPSSVAELDHFLTILHDRGSVLYLKGSTADDSWVVLDESALSSQVNGAIFAPKGFKEHCPFASSTGITTSSRIAKLLPKFSPHLIVHVLKSLEFCREIDPSCLRISNLSLGPSRADFSLQEKEQLLFFPSHIDEESCIQVIKVLRFCWCLECQYPYQVFPTRFLHLLLNKLSSLSFEGYLSDPSHVDDHVCTIWKKGIRWVSKNGIETVVEVLEHSTVLRLVMTCPEGMTMEHCHQRSMVIEEILDLKQKVCPSLAVKEMFVLPSYLQDVHYPPPPLSQLSVLSVKHVAQCVVEFAMCPIFSDTFDLYQNLGKILIESLFAKQDVRVSEKDISNIAAAFQVEFWTHDCVCELLGISSLTVRSRLSELPSKEQENPVRVCEEMFLVWQASDADGGTYESLRHRFDMFSVFAGRNPLKLAEGNGLPPFASPDDLELNLQPPKQ